MLSRTRHVAEQGIVLEHEADAPLLNGQPGRVFPGEHDAPCVGRFEPGDDPQDRALARTRGAEKGDELAGHDLERDVLHGLKGAIPLGEVLHFDAHG